MSQKNKAVAETALVAVENSAHSEPNGPRVVAAQGILAAHKSLQQHAGITLAYALWIGRALTKLRDSFRHKEWGIFRKRVIEPGGMSNTTIKRYIQMWRAVSPSAAELLPESLEDVKAGIDKLELPAATVTGVYRAFGMVATPAKSGNESGKKYRGVEKDGRLKFDDVRAGCQWLATMNDSLPSLTEIADCKNDEVREQWSSALVPIVDVAEAVGIEPKRQSRVTDTASAIKAIRSVTLWLQQAGWSMSGAEREAILEEASYIQKSFAAQVEAKPVKVKKPRKDRRRDWESQVFAPAPDAAEMAVGK